MLGGVRSDPRMEYSKNDFDLIFTMSILVEYTEQDNQNLSGARLIAE